MKFNLIQPISCGSAVRLVLQPTAGETRWRVLRKETNDIAGQDDPAAFLVHDGGERFLTDARLLTNGVTYHYAVYGETIPGLWSPGAVATAVPMAAFTDVSTDAQEVVRERLEVTLNGMIQRGLAPISKSTVAVMSIPFYQQGTDLPVVTVLYGNGAAAGHALGEQMSGESFDGDQWSSAQGWHSSVNLEVSCWSLNAEERNVLRRALQASLAANLEIFADAGLNMFEVQSVSDTEDTQSMSAPIYQTTIRLGCQVVVAVTDDSDHVESVNVFSLGA